MKESRLISFWKMSGSGNDFIIIDNRDLSLDVGDLPAFARRLCARKISVGADGLFLIEPSLVADFKWQFFNSDGSVAEMCGNGSRCVARWACQTGVTAAKLSIETLAGVIDAEVRDDMVKVRLTEPSPLKQNIPVFLEGGECGLDCIDTGVPHAVCFVASVEACDVADLPWSWTGIRCGSELTSAGLKTKRWPAARGLSHRCWPPPDAILWIRRWM